MLVYVALCHADRSWARPACAAASIAMLTLATAIAPDRSLYAAIAGLIPVLLLALVVNGKQFGPQDTSDDLGPATRRGRSVIRAGVASAVGLIVSLFALSVPSDATRFTASVATGAVAIVALSLITSLSVGGKNTRGIATAGSALLLCGIVALAWYVALGIAT
jgi:hypothetical protein